MNPLLVIILILSTSFAFPGNIFRSGEPGSASICDEKKPCPSPFACIEDRCINVCKEWDLCGKNAECEYKSDGAHCNCKEGTKGDPFVACTPVLKSYASQERWK